MALAVDEAIIEWVSLVVLVCALALSLIVIVRLSDDSKLLAPLRKRFVLGVPWGTLVVVLGVYGVYYLVQGGGDPGGPNVVGFRSWSIWYPQGILFASFSHASESHLMGNLFGTLAFASIAEYAWSHYPTRQGEQSFSSWRTNPYARIGVFVAGTFLVGIAASLFVPGAVIGFSSVVFAFAGFAIVTRPILTVLALVGIQAVRLVRRAFESPLTFATAEPRFVSPSWADTALQGHLFGLLVGVLLAVLLFRYRKIAPDLKYVWFAALVFAVTRSMYAVFWYLGEDEFVLFQAIGTAAVLLLATLVALAALIKDGPTIPAIDLPVRTVSLALLIVIVGAVALAAVPYNLAPVTAGDEVENGIDVRDYTVTYAEDVEDQYVSLDLPVARDVPGASETFSVEVSGVIVSSDERNVWAIDTPRERLAFEGLSVVVVGDATWREVVILNRTEWEMTGGNTTYKVFGQVWQSGDDRKQLYADEQVEAAPTINGSRISIEPSAEFYDVVVERNGTVIDTARVPSKNESVEIAGITFEREDDELYAIHDRTEIEIAKYRVDGRN